MKIASNSILALLFAFVLIFILCACGNNTDNKLSDGAEESLSANDSTVVEGGLSDIAADENHAIVNESDDASEDKDSPENEESVISFGETIAEDNADDTDNTLKEITEDEIFENVPDENLINEKNSEDIENLPEEIITSDFELPEDDEEDTSFNPDMIEHSPTSASIEVIDGITYVNGILIVNKTYSLPSTYAPQYPQEVLDSLNRMFSDASKAGYTFKTKSGYRSYIDQKIIYNNYVARDGKALADTYSARPGHSEHQSALAFDLNKLSTSFGDTPEGIWLAQNCHKYGFIIRYPKGKESITGYMYEPWHVRYLGVETATKVFESGLCLEEYLGISSEYSY